MKRKRFTLEQKNSFYGCMFILPWFIGLILFFIKPVFQSFTFSLNNIIMGPTGFKLEFIKLKNYVDAFTSDPKFPRLLSDLLINLVYDVPIILVFSFFVAVLLKEKFIGNSLMKAIFFLPVILGSGVFIMYQGDASMIQSATLNAAKQEGIQAIQVLKSLNIENYLLEAGFPPQMLVYITGPINRIYNVISSSGIQIFIFLAGLNSISPQIYEACYIEGATGWEAFWKITFPMISPLILVNTIYSTVDTFTSLKNAPMNYVYEMAFTHFNFGLSSAMSWIFFAFLALILGAIGYVISKRVFYQV